ncbi:MAG TPA: outer membrane beta-barrel protein [Bauldia sp.]|nr:outer membrane beta-barrel protein [Bauldia sp.]
MKFRGIALAAALVALGATSQAASAGPAAYNWSGIYIGGQLGYGWGTVAGGPTSVYDDPGGDPDATQDPFNYSNSGLIGGLEAGYNWQSGPMVLGVVGDFSGANIHGSYTDPDNAFMAESTISWLSTARVNIGVPLGSMLLYGTGGVAVAAINSSLHDYYDDDVVITNNAYNTKVGWTLGGGIAAPLGKNWFLKTEYLYVDLGTQNFNFSEPDPPGWALITSSNHTTANILRASLDYKF